jgi:DAACS family dicarboxylate/amino acid:cation (Na+ or H+) symporter
MQIMAGLILGCIIGYLWPGFGAKLQPLGTAFIKAIKMIVIPLVFSAVTLGICKMGSDLKSLGRLGGLAFVWFYLATGFCIVLGITLCMIFQPGAGVDLGMGAGVKLPGHLASNINWVTFFLDIIPDNAIAAMAAQKIIPTLFFAICFGLCLGAMQEKAKPMVDVLDTLMQAMFKLTQGIVATAPVAVCGIMAWVFATQGSKVLLAMAKLIGVLYLGLGIITIIFLIIVKCLGESPIGLLKKVMEPLLLAFTTASSEVTLPVHMEILERAGIPNRVVSFVLPLGYSFNLDGAALYQSLCVCFLAQAYGLPLDTPSIVTILITTLIANKGTANVPAASLVVLAVIMSSLGMPMEAMGILVGIDRFMDMGRTVINVFGNTIAALLLYRVGGQHLTDAVDEAIAAKKS